MFEIDDETQCDNDRFKLLCCNFVVTLSKIRQLYDKRKLMVYYYFYYYFFFFIHIKVYI